MLGFQISSIRTYRSIMYAIEGYWDVVPRIKEVSFPARGKMLILLQNGKIIVVADSKFPSVQKPNRAQRKKWYLIGSGWR